MSWLPPYGWWVRETSRKTVLRGWDWLLGAATLQHGVVSLPLSIWLTGSDAVGTAIWLGLSLVAAAGVGWSVVVDNLDFVFSHTWFAFPVTYTRLPRGTPSSVAEDFDAPDGADFGRTVCFGGDGPCFGARANADDLKAALDAAVARHHLVGARANADD